MHIIIVLLGNYYYGKQYVMATIAVASRNICLSCCVAGALLIRWQVCKHDDLRAKIKWLRRLVYVLRTL